MVSRNVDILFQAAQALSQHERDELRRLLDQRAALRSHSSADLELDQLLRRRGVIRTVPPPPTPDVVAQFKAWKPIDMVGGPLSDDLIRDRR